MSTEAGVPVLEVQGAQPKATGPPLSRLLPQPFDLRIGRGELVVAAAPDPAVARALIEICTGVAPLAAGRVRAFGQDWAQLSRPAAEALRGRIGIAPGDGGWLPHLSVEEGMLLPRLHHGGMPESDLRRQAEALARLFGLDGLPEGRPAELSRLDLARAACARAFLGEPALVLLESPLDMEVADRLVDPVLAALAPVRERGGAALWSTRSRRALEDPDFPASQRLHVPGEASP
jgi:phospholipid/cholesterol/gamma-HCH transport system ATP-binding protein